MTTAGFSARTVRILGKEDLIETLRDRADKFARALALEGHSRLIKKTPVDTGRARNNWNMARGSADVSTSDSKAYPKSGAGAINRGLAVLPEIQAGDVIYLTNGLPYIPVLEDGSSKQAPRGMIKITMAELRPLVDQIVRKLRAE